MIIIIYIINIISFFILLKCYYKCYYSFDRIEWIGLHCRMWRKNRRAKEPYYPSCHISALNIDCMMMIFSHLSVRDLMTCERGRKWDNSLISSFILKKKRWLSAFGFRPGDLGLVAGLFTTLGFLPFRIQITREAHLKSTYSVGQPLR